MSALAMELPCPSAAPRTKYRVLLVDDDESTRRSLKIVLEVNGFEVVAAPSVHGALQLIGSQNFDVLLSDLHVPQAGDGLTIVSAMRQVNAQAVTIVLSGYPEMEQASAILLQTNEILVKPLHPVALVDAIRNRLEHEAHPAREVESVAHILEREATATILDWQRRVEADPKILVVAMSKEQRSLHLPRLFHDVIMRLRIPLPLGSRTMVSPFAAEHGRRRRLQGYTPAMLVEEARTLQVSIFHTLQNNLTRVDFSLFMVGMMAITDELNSQLAQTMAGYSGRHTQGPVRPDLGSSGAGSAYAPATQAQD